MLANSHNFKTAQLNDSVEMPTSRVEIFGADYKALCEKTPVFVMFDTNCQVIQWVGTLHEPSMIERESDCTVLSSTCNLTDST